MFFPLRLPVPFVVIDFLCVLSTLFFYILMNTCIYIVHTCKGLHTHTPDGRNQVLT